MRPSLSEVRKWQRRLTTIKLNAEDLNRQIFDVYGPDGLLVAGGDCPTDYTDNLVEAAETLERILDAMADISRKHKEPTK